MGRKDFSDLEDQIRDTVKSALDAMDFVKIKKDIDDKTEDTINEVKGKFKDKSEKFNEKISHKMKEQSRKINNITSRNENKTKKYITKRPAGRIAGIFYTVFGAIGSGVLFILLASFTIYFASEGFSLAKWLCLGFMVSFLAACVVLTLRGRYLRNRVKRFRHYVKCLDGKDYCAIDDLAYSIGMKNKFIVKDLRKMIELEMFPQGHIDDKQTYFILNNEVYENYLDLQKTIMKRKEEELKKHEQVDEEIDDPVKKELKSTIKIGKSYIEQIKSVNDDIPEGEFSDKLERLQNIVIQIFKHVESNPQKLSEVNKFTNHYLPMTLKLVNSYKELNDQPVQGVNIQNAKNEIEKAIDCINNAFEKLLDDLFEEVALDISTDISVLETLFTQEGLGKKDFEK